MNILAVSTNADSTETIRRAFLRAVPGGDAAVFVNAVRTGVSFPEAMKAGGAPEALVAALEAAGPAQLANILDALTLPLERHRARQTAFRGAALYPFLLALVSMALAGIVLTVLRPAVAWVGDGPFKTAPPASAGPALLALGVSAAVLVLLGAVMLSRRPMFPFQEQRRQHERSLLLATATACAQFGATLPASLRAASHLSHDAVLSAECVALADALDRGGVQDEGVPLLGSLGAGLFRASAAKGAGGSSLGALAELHESTASAEMPGLLMKAQLIALGLGAFAVTAAGIALMLTYTGLLGGM